MLNEETFDDPKDFEIAKLKIQLEKALNKIDEFKAYDEKRKNYIDNLLHQIKNLKEQIQELKNLDSNIVYLETIEKYKLKNKNLKHQITNITKKLRACKSADKMSDDEVLQWHNQLEFEQKDKRIAKLKEKYDKLKEDYDDLIYRYAQDCK